MPASLYTDSTSTPNAGSLASRPRPNHKRTIYTMHSSKTGSKFYSSHVRSKPALPEMSPTAAVSSRPVPAMTSPTPSVLSTASSSISFFPPYMNQSRKLPNALATRSRSSSDSSVQSLSAVSDEYTSDSRSSSISSVSTTDSQTSQPRGFSLPSPPEGYQYQQHQPVSRPASITDAYRRRYASYLASTFNMSMDAALVEADHQLTPAQNIRRGSSISEAEILRHE